MKTRPARHGLRQAGAPVLRHRKVPAPHPKHRLAHAAQAPCPAQPGRRLSRASPGLGGSFVLFFRLRVRELRSEEGSDAARDLVLGRPTFVQRTPRSIAGPRPGPAFRAPRNDCRSCGGTGPDRHLFHRGFAGEGQSSEAIAQFSQAPSPSAHGHVRRVDPPSRESGRGSGEGVSDLRP